MSEARLHPDDLRILADLVADRIGERLLSGDGGARLGGRASEPVAPPEQSLGRPPGLVDAATVAAALGVTRETVYAHRDRLGARRLGDGARPRLRFDLAEAVAAWTARAESERSEDEERTVPAGDPRPRRRSRSGDALDSLPVRELQPRPIPTSGPGDAATSRGLATRRTPSPRHERTPTSGTSSRASAHACSSKEDA